MVRDNFAYKSYLPYGVDVISDWFSRRWYDYTGLSVEASLGEGWVHAFHSEDVKEAEKRWIHSLEVCVRGASSLSHVCDQAQDVYGSDPRKRFVLSHSVYPGVENADFEITNRLGTSIQRSTAAAATMDPGDGC